MVEMIFKRSRSPSREEKVSSKIMGKNVFLKKGEKKVCLKQKKLKRLVQFVK